MWKTFRASPSPSWAQSCATASASRACATGRACSQRCVCARECVYLCVGRVGAGCVGAPSGCGCTPSPRPLPPCPLQTVSRLELRHGPPFTLETDSRVVQVRAVCGGVCAGRGRNHRHAALGGREEQLPRSLPTPLRSDRPMLRRPTASSSPPAPPRASCASRGWTRERRAWAVGGVGAGARRRGEGARPHPPSLAATLQQRRHNSPPTHTLAHYSHAPRSQLLEQRHLRLRSVRRRVAALSQQPSGGDRGGGRGDGGGAVPGALRITSAHRPPLLIPRGAGNEGGREDGGGWGGRRWARRVAHSATRPSPHLASHRLPPPGQPDLNGSGVQADGAARDEPPQDQRGVGDAGDGGARRRRRRAL